MFSRLRSLSLIALLATAACDDSPTVTPKDHAEGLYIKGTAEYLQGHFEASLASFEEMRKLAPTDPRLPAARGEVFLSMGKLAEAATEFEAALKQDPKRSTNWSRLGFVQAQLGRPDEALSSLRKAVALYPNDFNALEQLGEIHLKKGEQDEAIRHFILAANAASGSVKSELVLRTTEVLIQVGRQQEVLALVQKAANEGIRTAAVLTALGDALVRAGKLPEAAAAYKEAASKSPRDPTLWELVGTIQLQLDKPGEAIDAYKESLRVKDRAIVHVALARIQLAMKSKQGAEQELAAALESVQGNDVRELRELADLLVTMERKPDALRILASLSAEHDLVKDADLQLSTARLARELKDVVLEKAACARALAADPRVKKCP
ncbi:MULTISPECIES: lipopolysaccharide assembly protein LapB [Myxococcus]|uniref:Tetratricopeptide repeat protein n=1 Tax=Myxococcus llanfairpwllgwyngyllgogerychwyrndrobwllllantysiliogogogochensis TaxID=2590453 RepID=A0A540WK89_9BACT|nr:MULTISPECIES: tetratricopeptide repeat protein [Myxococcus]NTX01906.1 tetratricopeptide repeat protein [Myxococcus sp. CA040A]TQF09408.1 tetratricopeptide repeat protein [Myxococcus llanfairpwllgwyngyllgogerychwyrndrobwllllantysiliogogogochensis]